MKETKFFRLCLASFTRSSAKKSRQELIAYARKLGADDNERATELFMNAEAWLRSDIASSVASLTSTRQATFMVWLTKILYSKRPLQRADFLYEWATYCLGRVDNPHYAKRALQHALSIRRREYHDWTRLVNTLSQLALALDETGRRRRATQVLEIACRLCDGHQVEPVANDTCLRLSAAAHAWQGDLDTALKRMDQASAINATVNGASPLQSAIAWTISICRYGFPLEGPPYTLRTAFVIASMDMADKQRPADRWFEVDGLMHALDRTPHSLLAILSIHTTLWLASEATEYIPTAGDLATLFNNYGNALAGANLSERALAVFGRVLRCAEENTDPSQQADANYQCIHAYSGFGFVHFNLGMRAIAHAEKHESFHQAAYWFSKAAQQCKQVGSRAWFEGRGWACAGLVQSYLGHTEQAWFYFAWALLAGFSNWGHTSNLATLEGFLNPDSFIRLKMVEGFERLNARHAAVLFGKAAVHAVYREAYPSETLESIGAALYLRSRSDAHRKLAQSLTITGRYNEAEQAFALLKDDAWGVYTRRDNVPVEIEAAVAVNQAEAAGLYESGIMSFLTSIPMNESLSDATIARMGELLAGLDHAIETQINRRKMLQRHAQGNLSPDMLASGDARIRYLVSPTYMTITVEVGASISTCQTDDTFAGISLISFALRQSHSASQRDFLELSSALYRALIKPVADALEGVTHLWIETDSPLDGVPFAALFDGERYLFERYSIAYFNAAGSLMPASTAHSYSSVTVFACSELADGRLPGAALEREFIQGALKSKIPPAACEAYSHNECSIDRMLGKLALDGQSNCAIHLATHAVFNATSDSLSMLALADGNLSINRLRKATERKPSDLGLFVLSACGTARQDLDVEGFSLTLLRGGVRSVVSSLWETLDVSAPTFFRIFYETCQAFESPRSIAIALREAQISLNEYYRDQAINTGMSQAAHWAPYVVITGRIG
ncbi:MULTISPECIES: CHAT domain-containing protein [Pseudomonas]|uniref:CHAT domain-containing protein n=1 Tax=Pseudomonas TaxID=286 RepID=UPI0004847DAB|nr:MULTISPECIES: CHAT domain-containing protein [unclassified Pseudomonas]